MSDWYSLLGGLSHQQGAGTLLPRGEGPHRKVLATIAAKGSVVRTALVQIFEMQIVIQ